MVLTQREKHKELLETDTSQDCYKKVSRYLIIKLVIQLVMCRLAATTSESYSKETI